MNKEDDLDYQHYLKTLSKNYRNMFNNNMIHVKNIDTNIVEQHRQ